MDAVQQLSTWTRQAFLVARAAAAGLLLLLVGVMLAGAAPALIGYESYVVLSGSMEPTLQVGDLAVVGPVRPEDLQVRDIISYRTPIRPNVVVTHRLVGISTNEAGRLLFETRGDANDSVDQVEVDAQAVLGRVVYGVPKIGYLVQFARQPLGKVVLLGLPALFLMVDALLGRRTTRPTPLATEQLTLTPDLLMRRAWVSLSNGRPAEAAMLLNQALAQNPDLEDAWLLLAECQSDAGARLTCLWKAVASNPHSIPLREAADAAAAEVRRNATRQDDASAGLTYGHASR
ncbi:MAG: signal peptidase I [Chloroflexi bacterium]|nr:signal peptidase I [Chloroflexota bacterium]